MQIQPLSRPRHEIAFVEKAHAAINAAFNALAADEAPRELQSSVLLARGYVGEARTALATVPTDGGAGHDGPDDASAAARAVLPRLDHALVLLEALGVAPDPANVAPLLDELGLAMDHVEETLVAAGWD